MADGEVVLDVANGGSFVQKATDPVMANAALPGDFAAQYPTPLDTTEIITMCEEITVWQTIPVKKTALKQETWRELNALAFTSGSTYIAFADYVCPEEYSHSGENTTVDLKNIGAKKSLGISDIMHSAAVAAAGWNGINRLVGGFASGEGMPGGNDAGTFIAEHVADLKEKEVRLGMTLLLNGLDRLLVLGNATAAPLEFNGIEPWFVNICTTEHTNDNSASGSFTAIGFDRFLSEGCAKPTTVFGHPTAIQELLSAYFQLGWQGSQQVTFSNGDRIVPGYNFAGFVNTGVGRLQVVADNNFTRTNIAGGNFQTNLFAMRMTHNGEPFVYRSVQIPLSMKDLTPGCTAISFELWEKSALIIKACYAHGVYQTQFTGRLTTTCTAIG